MPVRSLHLPDLDAHLCYHDLAGRDPVWVYLHGMGTASSSDFPAIVRHPGLTPYRALLVDLLGSGFSDRPDAFSYTLEAHAATVARLLDHLVLRGCRLVGHSFGGSVAIVLAATRPDLVDGLVVAEPNLEPEDATLSRTVADQTEEAYVRAGHAELIAQAEEWAAETPAWADFPGTLRATDPAAMHRGATSLVAASLSVTFFGLSLPRTYVFGALSLPHHHEEQLRGGEVRVAVVPGAGHGMMGENPDGVAQVLADTLP